MLALVGTMLWCGFSAWRAAPYPRREAYAALFAAMLAFAVGAAFDWFWEIADVGAIFILAGGVLVSVRCAQIAQEEERRGGQRSRRYGLALAGLAAAWISAVALVGPLLVDHEITESRSDAASGDLAGAVDHASTARSIEPWAATPYVQLAQLAELQGEYPTAIADFTLAIERENHNWQYYYLRAQARLKAGEAATAAGETAGAKTLTAEANADLRRAKELNPRAPELASVPG